jgi:nitrate/TMAO reductase-like tetraheme cytochrome c subunit
MADIDPQPYGLLEMMKTPEHRAYAPPVGWIWGLMGAVLLTAIGLARTTVAPSPPAATEPGRRVVGVCPPYPLRDERGDVINPVLGLNTTAPYSPRQTCGAIGCHDYNKITQGYHFTQGQGEPVPSDMAARYQWVTSPGNYGGTWCSPAPLYRYLAPKTNASATTIDMTSATFITAGCGNCHPGGGPLEFDRDGKRYDLWMSDPASGLSPGGDNQFDGDYYKARWSETGVVEADCLLCHLPEYDINKRNDHLKKLNFRWAATEGAGFGQVTGSVASNQTPQVAYDLKRFDAAGNVKVRVVTQPRNETCLNCHAQPGWKKRGADFRARTDVHLRAGMRCVDCHPAGSHADDPRIQGREVHQIAKGDDPGGRVRDDLDNTVRSCASCHSSGQFGAPIATHPWLPPLHLDTIACQTCHTPEKRVMPIQVQASDVFNPDAWIDPGMKQLWTFYGVDGLYRNHYGLLRVMGYDDKPTETFRPVLARYKDKIYPVNRIHSTWPGIETPGKPGLMQPRPPDIYKMWTAHLEDPARYPELARIQDHDGDGVKEVNRAEEIEALIAAVTRHLTSLDYDLKGKRVVWVSNERVYHSGTEYRVMDKAEWEASPFANEHKYNHDVAPARAALGSGGCTDCHASNSRFFDQAVLLTAFSPENGGPRWTPNYAVLGYSPWSVKLGAVREETLKPWTYALLALVGGLILLLALRGVALRHSVVTHSRLAKLSWLSLAGLVLGGILVARSPDLTEYMTVRRLTLDAAHFWVGVGILLLAVVLALQHPTKTATQCTPPALARILWGLIVFTGLCGGLVLLRIGWLEALTRLAYTGFDVGLFLLLLVAAMDLVRRLARVPRSTRSEA